MVEVGSMSIGGSIQTAEIERGLGRVEKGFKDIETTSKGVNADFVRINQQADRLAKHMSILAIAGGTAMIAMAKGAPAVAGSMAKIRVSMMKLRFALGEALKPAFEWFSNKLSWIASWIQENPDLFGSLTTGVLIFAGALAAVKFVGFVFGVNLLKAALIGLAGVLGLPIWATATVTLAAIGGIAGQVIKAKEVRERLIEIKEEQGYISPIQYLGAGRETLGIAQIIPDWIKRIFSARDRRNASLAGADGT